jgi:hypothetical protein
MGLGVGGGNQTALFSIDHSHNNLAVKAKGDNAQTAPPFLHMHAHNDRTTDNTGKARD